MSYDVQVSKFRDKHSIPVVRPLIALMALIIYDILSIVKASALIYRD